MKALWPVLALLVIIGCAAWLFLYYRSQPAPGQAVAHRAPVACEACGQAYITMISKEPAKCYFCGETTVWSAAQCVKCGAIVPIVGGPSYRAASSLRCPECEGTRFKEVPPDELEEH